MHPIAFRPLDRGFTNRNVGMLEYWNSGFWPPAHGANPPFSRPYGLEAESHRIQSYWVNGPKAEG